MLNFGRKIIETVTGTGSTSSSSSPTLSSSNLFSTSLPSSIQDPFSKLKYLHSKFKNSEDPREWNHYLDRIFQVLVHSQGYVANVIALSKFQKQDDNKDQMKNVDPHLKSSQSEQPVKRQNEKDGRENLFSSANEDNNIYLRYFIQSDLSHNIQEKILFGQSNPNIHLILLKNLNFLITNIQTSHFLEELLVMDDLILSCITFSYYDFKNNEELMNYHISLLKSLSLKLTPGNSINYLIMKKRGFSEENNDNFGKEGRDVEKNYGRLVISCPLLDESSKYLESENEIIRITCRNIILTVINSKIQLITLSELSDETWDMYFLNETEHQLSLTLSKIFSLLRKIILSIKQSLYDAYDLKHLKLLLNEQYQYLLFINDLLILIKKRTESSQSFLKITMPIWSESIKSIKLGLLLDDKSSEKIDVIVLLLFLNHLLFTMDEPSVVITTFGLLINDTDSKDLSSTNIFKEFAHRFCGDVDVSEEDPFFGLLVFLIIYQIFEKLPSDASLDRKETIDLIEKYLHRCESLDTVFMILSLKVLQKIRKRSSIDAKVSETISTNWTNLMKDSMARLRHFIKDMNHHSNNEMNLLDNFPVMIQELKIKDTESDVEIILLERVPVHLQNYLGLPKIEIDDQPMHGSDGILFRRFINLVVLWLTLNFQEEREDLSLNIRSLFPFNCASEDFLCLSNKSFSRINEYMKQADKVPCTLYRSNKQKCIAYVSLLMPQDLVNIEDPDFQMQVHSLLFWRVVIIKDEKNSTTLRNFKIEVSESLLDIEVRK